MIFDDVKGLSIDALVSSCMTLCTAPVCCTALTLVERYTGFGEKYSEKDEIGEEDVKVDFMLEGRVDWTCRNGCEKEGLDRGRRRGWAGGRRSCP